MKRKHYFLFLSAMLALAGCKGGNSDTSTGENNDTSSISFEDEIIDGAYEGYKVTFDMNASALSCPIQFDKLGDLDEYIFNPIRYITNKNTKTVKVSVCGAANYKDQTVVYTPDWHFRTTLARDASEGTQEYVILPDGNGGYVVDSVLEGGENVIPVNGLIISIPSAVGKSFNVGESVEVGFDFNQYQSAIYNQDNERIGFKYVNNNYFFWLLGGDSFPSPAFFDTNADSDLVQQTNTSMVSVTFDYDEENKAYIPTDFAKKNAASKQRMDINDGFALLMAEDLSTAIKLDKGVLISEGDKFYFENVPGFYDQEVVLSTTEVNKISGEFITVSVDTNNNTDYGPWSYQVAVSNNVVVDRAVKVDVPANGYKLTIRSAANPANPEDASTIESITKLVLDLFRVGTSIERRSNTITVINNLESSSENYISYVKQEVESAIDLREEELYDVNTTYAKQALTEIDNIKTKLDSLRGGMTTPTDNYYFYNLVNQIDNIHEAVISSTTTTQAVNMHSVWHYPTETTLYDLQKTLHTFAKNNINEVFIDILSEGYTFYKSDLLYEHETVKNGSYGEYKDYLEAFVTEAHKLGMKVQVIGGQWMQHKGVTELYGEFESYYALNINGENKQMTMDGEAQYFDPANDAVTDFFLELYDEVLSNYDVDGLHLDGIRYGASNDNIEQSQGITDAARIKFNEWLIDNNKSGSYADMESFRSALRQQSTFLLFNEFRRDVVTSFVRQCNELAKEHNVLTTAAVVAGLSYAKSGKMQAWDEWSQEGIVDGLYLMSYYVDGIYVSSTVSEAVSACSKDTYIVGGVSPIYSSLPGIEVAKQIDAANVEGSVGSSIFAGHSFSVRPDITDYLNPTTGGVYSNQTTVVYDKLNTSMKSFKDSLIKRSEEIYQPANAQTAEQFSALKADLEILVTVTTEADSLSEAEDVLVKLEAMINGVANYGNDKAQDRILETLQYAKLVTLHKIGYLS